MARLHPFTGLAFAGSAALVSLAADRWWLSLAIVAACLVLARRRGITRRLAGTAAAVLAPLWLSQLLVHAVFDRTGSHVLLAEGPVRLTVEGLTTAETAEVLETSEDVVKTRLRRGKALLQETLSAMADRRLAEAFPFGARRCDRMVSVVMRRIESARSGEE